MKKIVALLCLAFVNFAIAQDIKPTPIADIEVNNKYVPILEEAGLRMAGRSTDNSLVEVIEYKDHPWFVASQFHPEFTSSPRDGHPLFRSFIEAALVKQAGE